MAYFMSFICFKNFTFFFFLRSFSISSVYVCLFAFCLTFESLISFMLFAIWSTNQRQMIERELLTWILPKRHKTTEKQFFFSISQSKKRIKNDTENVKNIKWKFFTENMPHLCRNQIAIQLCIFFSIILSDWNSIQSSTLSSKSHNGSTGFCDGLLHFCPRQWTIVGLFNMHFYQRTSLCCL